MVKKAAIRGGAYRIAARPAARPLGAASPLVHPGTQHMLLSAGIEYHHMVSVDFFELAAKKVLLESLSRRLSSSEVQTRTCESAGRDDDVWPVLPDHKTCLGHAGVHGRRVRAPSWPSSPSLRHVSAGHSNDAEEATDTSRSARASRRDVAGQPEPPEALDSSVGAAGTPAAHPLRRESAASYFEEARLFRTRAPVWYVLI